ncbi:hypothetical protein J7I98_23305 [Streptomyces sp. ISL-98]|nr:hypothetical protein [Streptomyces sp. ISL-98]MBT2508759.1 hypothetical protein [Streptomyces sp. ISL-98]
MHEPIERVRGRLAGLGVPVADPRKAVRAALPRAPLRDAGEGPPEAG